MAPVEGGLEHQMSTRARKDPREFLRDIAVPDDGVRPVRKAGAHSRDKLAILSYYIHGFAQACKDKAPKFYFADGFAGEGLYRFDDDTFALGSTLIALEKARPSFARCIALELDAEKARALKSRVQSHGSRAVVEVGDCNRDLLGLMQEHIPHDVPILVLLDPNAFELQWKTVESLAAFRTGRWKTEMLILVATGLVGRAPAGLVDNSGLPANDRLDLAFPPGSAWAKIIDNRVQDKITAQAAREALAADYRAGLEALGYATVLPREITHPGRGSAKDGAGVYHLLFASDNPAGESIMESAFERVYTNRSKVVQSALDRGQGVWEEFFQDR